MTSCAKLATYFLAKYAENTEILALNSKPIHLYRGMRQSEYQQLISSGQFIKTKHPGNVASTNYETALHYAGQWGDEDDPGLVVGFEAPSYTVEQSFFKSDYRFVANFKPINLEVIRQNITGPIKEAIINLYLPKYAGNAEDLSLGKPINAIKTRQLKDKLILVYDKLTKDITTLPAFQTINETLSDNLHWIEVNRLIINLVNYVNDHDLKQDFNYAIKLIEKLNELRSNLVSMPKEEKVELDLAIKSIQDTIWEESKRFLNIHNLRGVDLDFPELSDILGKVVPTWDFGKGKNPAKPAIKQRYHTVSELMKRLEKENKEEAEAKLKGHK